MNLSFTISFKHFFLPPLLLSIFLIHSPSFTSAQEIFESFDTLNGYTRNLQYSRNDFGTYAIQNGTLLVTQPPYYTYHSVNMEKTYTYDLSQTSWFHFRFKFPTILTGSDVYNRVTFYRNNNPNDPLSIVMGINGEQHWIMTYNTTDPHACTPKTGGDDELFIAVSPQIFPGASDTRLSYPTGYRKSYSDWMIYSIRYDPPSVTGSRGLFSFYIDGRELTNLIPLDDPNAGPLNTYTDALSNLNVTQIKISTEILVDGAEYGYTGNKYGIRGRGCYTQFAPGVATPLTFPSAFIGNDGTALKTAWMNHFDRVATIFFEVLNTYKSWPLYQNTRSSINWLDQIPRSHPSDLYREYAYRQENPSFKSSLESRMWTEIFAGTADLETAILTGLFDLPNASHTIWQYHPTGTRDRIAAELASYSEYDRFPAPQRFVWRKIFTIGDVPNTVHLGYLAPEEIRTSPAWTYLSATEKASIPQSSSPTDGQVAWDYVWLSRQAPNAPTPTLPPATITPIPPPNPYDYDSDLDVDFLDLYHFLRHPTPNLIQVFNRLLSNF